jgi:hypothetical protein
VIVKKLYSTPLIVSTDVVRSTDMGPVTYTKDVSTLYGILDLL